MTSTISTNESIATLGGASSQFPITSVCMHLNPNIISKAHNPIPRTIQICDHPGRAPIIRGDFPIIRVDFPIITVDFEIIRVPSRSNHYFRQPEGSVAPKTVFGNNLKDGLRRRL